MFTDEIFELKWELLILKIQASPKHEFVDEFYSFFQKAIRITNNRYILRGKKIGSQYNVLKLAKTIYDENTITHRKLYIVSLPKEQIRNYVIYGWDGYEELKSIKNEVQRLEKRIKIIYNLGICDENGQKQPLSNYTYMNELYQLYDKYSHLYTIELLKAELVKWLREYFLTDYNLDNLYTNDEEDFITEN